MSPRFLLAFAVSAAFIVACGSRTDLVTAGDMTIQEPLDAAAGEDSASTTPPPALADGTLAPACGPADGPASTLTFTVGPLACGDVPSSNFDQIDLFSQLTGPGTLSFNPSGLNGAGDAESCVGTTCTEATHVTLDVTAFSSNAGTASGQYTLVLTDGTTVSRTFVVNQCPGVLGCG